MAVDDVTASPGRRNTARSAGRPGRYADDAAVASPGRSKVRTVQQVDTRPLEVQMTSRKPPIHARVDFERQEVFVFF